MHGQEQGRPGAEGGLVDVAQVLGRLGERQAPLPPGGDPDRAEERPEWAGRPSGRRCDREGGHAVAVGDAAQLRLERRLQGVALVRRAPKPPKMPVQASRRPASGRPGAARSRPRPRAGPRPGGSARSPGRRRRAAPAPRRCAARGHPGLAQARLGQPAQGVGGLDHEPLAAATSATGSASGSKNRVVAVPGEPLQATSARPSRCEGRRRRPEALQRGLAGCRRRSGRRPCRPGRRRSPARPRWRPPCGRRCRPGCPRKPEVRDLEVGVLADGDVVHGSLSAAIASGAAALVGLERRRPPPGRSRRGRPSR